MDQQKQSLIQRRFDEISAVKSILSNDHEIQIPEAIQNALENSSQFDDNYVDSWKLKIQMFKNNSQFELTVYTDLGGNYPEQALPECNVVSSNIPKQQIQNLNEQISQIVIQSGEQGEEVLYPIIEHIQQYIEQQQQQQQQNDQKNSTNTNNSDSNERIISVLIGLDHIRDPNRYLKTLKKWSIELNVNGCIIIFGKIIRGAIQSSERSTKEFLRRWRTEDVDVNSRGRPCKERLMKKFMEKECVEILQQPGFVFEQVNSKEEVINALRRYGFDVQDLEQFM